MLNKSLLKPCDVLLFRTTHKSSLIDRVIVWGQRTFYHAPLQARYCHVALVDQNTDFILEAKWPKVKQSSITDYTYKQKDQIEVYRIKNITDEQREKILNDAQEHIGEWYSISLFLFGWTTAKHSVVCSTYVSKSCKAADLIIPYGSDNKKLILPDDYYKDVGLNRIM